ncbi:serine hydrolase [Algoriphagus chordae]|uniref:CubicO group peptidase (Beta-lactamase class C family) n=1 Tax=Algoriphagus chordae TaxID=237019 RepID=A0A2W7RXG1_9BACT|nr:serine hydrolase [Algoriphagus chordae]PZX55615.1 CubicO group peptidase (beta-lactamase class C family) [Algoriphagus chordae]
MKHFLTIILISLSTYTFGQSRNDKRIIDQIDKIILESFENVAPGCAILIAKDGKVILEKAYGTANLELGVATKPEMVFRIGSITKQFTAIAILQLVEKGDLALTDSIQKFIKNFQFKGKTITIENLLTHTSGIRGYEQFDSKIPNAMRVEFPIRAMIDSLDKVSLEFEPNTQFNYSNSNYYLLGYIIEQITGKSYQQYLEENIFGPAGLNSTYYENQIEIIPNRTNGYSFSNGKYWNVDFISMSLVYSAGALRSNVSDLFKWHKALNEGKLIRKETFLNAITPYKFPDGKLSNYGYGFFIDNETNRRSFGHPGAIDGFRAVEMYYPEEDIFITLLGNSDRDNLQNLFETISNIILENNSTKSDKELMLSSSTIANYVGLYKNEEYDETIKIYSENGNLYADFLNGTGYKMVLKSISSTKFILPDIRRIKTYIEFIYTEGQVTKIITTQTKSGEYFRIDNK